MVHVQIRSQPSLILYDLKYQHVKQYDQPLLSIGHVSISVFAFVASNEI